MKRRSVIRMPPFFAGLDEAICSSASSVRNGLVACCLRHLIWKCLLSATLLCVTAAAEPPGRKVLAGDTATVAEGDADAARPVDSLTKDEKDAVILRVGQLFREHYVFPRIGIEIEQTLRDKNRDNAFDAIEDPELFRKAFRDVIRDVVDDKHILIMHHTPRPEHARQPNEETSDLEAQFKQRKAINFGIPELKVLEHNIGYIKISKFTSPELFGPVMRASSEYLKHVDGLILDLRSRGGGRSETVLLLLSYFLPPNTHVLNWRFRDTDEIEKNWTLPAVGGHRFADVPIVILTSERTFSGSEAFCYVMKHHQRATIVGEITRGGAHTYKEMVACDRYLVLVPYGRAISTKTNRNWEGEGVVPTIASSADDALTIGMKRLVEAIEPRAGDLSPRANR